ncbi:uncharacterized protein LOC141988794 [Natator depressus]|uniref:uncharacterized protein LOC141988794 n=1 Tax=Natator depressus TaxID=27790 RepID=UPI003EBA57CD
MGNANNKRPIPPPSSKPAPEGMVERLQEDVTCSICLDILEDPVSIECGHNFCRGCLAAHWSRVSAWGYECPECRAPCSRNQMTPDTRLKSLVEKIRDLPREETLTATGIVSPEPGPRAQPGPGHPVQLVCLDEKGGLTLDKEALSHCLEQGGVGDAPVCLVSIIGEQRRGKSFLLNYLLRRLRSLDVKDGSWMGREEEHLKGFEWRVGAHRVTEGVWAWSQPFWVPSEEGQVAVLLVDTEGSMDIARDTETSVKLSALSMLLGSYQILNVSSQLKDPDLEYLEMFLHVAEEVGKEYGLESIQQLDLLVRDWSNSLVLGTDGGKEHLRDVRQMLAARSPCKHPKALEALTRSKIRCYLMPFPGKRIMTGSQGCLRDMDEDFRDSLRDYVTGLVASAGQHVWRDRHGALVTGSQLAAKIKTFSDLMKKRCFDFSSPAQMAITFHNQRVLDRASADHAVFLREKDGDSRTLITCLKVRPSKMAELFAERRGHLLRRCWMDMRESALEKEAQLTELEEELTREAETFLQSYGKRFMKFVIAAGVSAGAVVLAPVGGAAGIGIAAAALGMAEAAALGAGVGAMAGIVVGGGVGGGVGGNIAQKDRQRAKAAVGRREEEDGTEDLSEDTPLISPEEIMQRLREDIPCSICLDFLDDPVSIECGHKVCQGCFAAHWSPVSSQTYWCPECCHPCSKHRMIPDTLIKNLVEKIGDTPLEVRETECSDPALSLQEGPGAQPEPGRPVQLARLDEEGDLILDEEALSHCLEQGGVGDAPVCLVSIIGEQRRGKSFLLNCLLHQLRSPDARDESWMGQEDELLEGFEWRADMQRVTKGVWAWSQPFWVPAKGEKVAVLLVDTEGSMDIERNKETSIKLSALSMLLSSYQILNIGCQVKDPDLEYLEMFVQVAEVVGEVYGLDPIQHLDLLVRDWSSSQVLGAQGGEQHLRHVRQMLAATSPCKHPKALEMLKRNSTRCYLMPFPGKRIVTGMEGTLRGMDEDFRERLRDYITAVVGSASRHVRRDRHGELLTGTQLAAKIKNLCDMMKKHCFGFSSPCQPGKRLRRQTL